MRSAWKAFWRTFARAFDILTSWRTFSIALVIALIFFRPENEQTTMLLFIAWLLTESLARMDKKDSADGMRA